MATLVQVGESIEGQHTDGTARKTCHNNRPQLVDAKRFYRSIIDRGAELEITKELPTCECLCPGSNRKEGDRVAGEKIRVLSENPIRCDASNPKPGSARHQTQSVSTRCHTIARIMVRYVTIPARLQAPKADHPLASGIHSP